MGFQTAVMWLGGILLSNARVLIKVGDPAPVPSHNGGGKVLEEEGSYFM